MNVYLINRADRPARLLHALDQLRSVRLASHVTRIEACTPERAQRERFVRFAERAVANIESRGKRLDMLPTWGAAACARSHAECWKHALERPLSLIVEDDLEFTDPQHFQFQYQKALYTLNIHSAGSAEEAHRPRMWCFGARSRVPTAEEEVTRLRGIFTGMHCYLLTRSAAVLLLKYCAICTYQVDVQIGRLANVQQHASGGLVVYNSAHAGVRQAARFDSDVQPIKHGQILLPLLLRRKRLPESVARIITAYLRSAPYGGHYDEGDYGDGYDDGYGYYNDGYDDGYGYHVYGD